MPTDPRVCPEARAVLDRLLSWLDTQAPGLVKGAHLVGSIALGDARPGQSDIDLVLVRSAGFDNPETAAALTGALSELLQAHPAPVVDGLVIDAADLAAGPGAIGADRPCVQQGKLGQGEGGLGNPVTWAILRQCGIAYRGELVRDRLWHDPAGLDAWTRENLESYWRPWLARAEGLATRPDLPGLIDEATEWGVLGVTRLHYTLATGLVISKRGAGTYALEAFPVCWQPIVEEAIRIRERRSDASRFPDPVARTHAIREYMEMVIDDALAMPPLNRDS